MKKNQTSRHLRRPALATRLAVEPLEPRWLLSVSPTSIDDQITLAGSHLTVHGTEESDSFELSTGSEYRLTLNGSTRQFAAGSIDRITLIGGDEDTILLHDTAGNDTIYASPGETRLLAPSLTVEAMGARTLIVRADMGGVDVAHLSDSPGDDLFLSTPDTATLSGNGFSVQVHSVEYVHAYARLGGTDRAEIHGSNRDESLVGRADWSRLAGDGYASRAKFFDQVVVHAGGGTDHARIYGSAGDDFLSASPTEATLSGQGFSNTALGFDSVTASAGSGNDWADLLDSPGNDTLHTTPAQTTLFGRGFINRAVGFDGVHAYARRGGYDIASLHDSAGNDRYVGTDEWGKLLGDGYFIRAKFFDSIYAYADAGGTDTAELRGASGTDRFESRSTHSWLRGNNYEHRVGAFDSVSASASTGIDEALIIDSDSVDELLVEDRTVRLTEGPSGNVRQAVGFNVVTARLSQQADQALVAENTPVDLRIVRSGPPTVLRGVDFLDLDSPALGLQDAIDALPEEGGTIVLPAGSFTLRQGLVLRSGVTLQGAAEGTTLARPDHLETRLTATASTGMTSVAVQSVAGFRVGDDVAILAYGDTNVVNRTILRIEPGRLYLDQPIAVSGTLTPENYATVVNYFPLVRTSWTHENVATANLVLENLALDGNLDESSEAWRLAAPSLIHLERASDSVIRNLNLRNANTGGIFLTAGHDNRVENTTVEKVRGHGIYAYFEDDAVVSGVTVRQAGYATRGVSGDGIFVVGSDNVLVQNSLVERSLRHGLHPGGDLNRGGIWTNNISRNNGENGFHFCFDNFDMLVTGNILEGNARYGVGGLGLGGDFGDFFNTVADNLIRNNAKYGIQVNGGSDNTITTNTIIDNSQLRSGQFSGISLANSTFVVVADNRIGTASGTPKQKHGVEEAGTANDNFIVRNDTSANVLGGIYVTGPTTFVSGNTGSVHFEGD